MDKTGVDDSDEKSVAENVTIQKLPDKGRTKSIGKLLKKLKKTEDQNDKHLPPIQKSKENLSEKVNEALNETSSQFHYFPLLNYQLNNPDMPDFVKESIEKKAESYVSFDIYDKVDFDDYCNLKNIHAYFGKLRTEQKMIKNLNFNSIDCLTDLVFYIFYKYFNDKEMWKNLERVTLDSCRYITDFGIQLLYEATGKNRLIDPNTSAGCSKIFNYFYYPEVEEDIFLNKRFNNWDLKENEQKIELNSYKILILNDTKLSVTQFIKSKSFQDRNIFIDYSQVNVDNYNFNILEIESLCYSHKSVLSINTPSSILIVYMNFKNYKNHAEFMEDLAGKFMEILNQGVKYLKIILMVKDIKIEKDEVIIKNLVEYLQNGLKKVIDDETDILNMNFLEQEKFRDKIRLKLNLEKFIQKPDIEFFHLTDETCHNKLLNQLKKNLKQRYQSKLFQSLTAILNEKMEEKRILKFEEFIDTCYTNKNYDFKAKIQDDINFGKLMENFFQFKSFLGECLIFKLLSGENIVIPNPTWFNDSISKIIENFSSKDISFNSSKNIYTINYDTINKENQLNINKLEFDILIEILNSMKILNPTCIKNQFIIFSKYVPETNKMTQSYKDFWPQTQDGSLKIRTAISLYFKLPEQVLNELMSKFLILPNVCFMDENCVICQEGSMNLCILYEKSTKNLTLMVRNVDLSLMIDENDFSTVQTNVNKMMIALANEYKLVLEAVLINNKIPFKYAKAKIEGIKKNGKIYTNIEDKYIDVLNNDPGSLLVTGHKFRHNEHDLYKCNDCSIDSNWSKLVHESYRSLFPMFTTNKFWNLKYLVNENTLATAKIEKFSNGSTFNVGNEILIFQGSQEMSPFIFDCYSTYLISDFKIEFCQIGVLIKDETGKECRVLLCIKTRRIIKRISNEDFNFNKNFELIETQRYKRKIKTAKSIRNFNQDASLKQQDLKVQLMKEIQDIGKNSGDSKSMLLRRTYEIWPINSGDCVTVRLKKTDKNSCDILFFYNEELIGNYLIENLSSVTIFPQLEVQKGEKSSLFFDLNSAKFKSQFGNSFCFKPGMFIEIELVLDQLEQATYNDAMKNYITLAMIESIDETGCLNCQIPGLNEITSIEPTSNLIHPCGYWNYVYKELIQKMNMNEYNDIIGFNVLDQQNKKYLKDSLFDWTQFFKDNPTFQAASFDTFLLEQREEMPKSFYPEINQIPNYLSCDFMYNPRYIWSSLNVLSSDDLTSIYQNLGMIKQGDDVDSETQIAGLSAIVLLPKTINQNFIDVPNIKSVDSMSNLMVSCIHREHIKLFIGNQSFININYPHLLEGKYLNLIEENIKLSLKYVIVLLCTCLDLKNSQNENLFPNFKLESDFDSKKFNQSLKHYFDQLSSCISLIIPFFYDLKFRLDKRMPIKDIIIDQSIKHFSTPNSSSESLQAQESVESKKFLRLENFIAEKIKEFSISSNGMCKYCNVFNIDLSTLNLKPGTSLDNFFKKAFKRLDEFSRIITSISIKDTIDFTVSEHKTISLNHKLFKTLPNLVNISLHNIKIKEIDRAINHTKYLKNIEFHNNYLTEIPDDLLNKNKSLTQIIIDNQPIKEIPHTLFCLKNLKSIVLNRLNIEKLPSGWLKSVENTINIRSINISECKLQYLPDDLVANNPCLEELIFQGVNLILPENETQWALMSVDLNKVIELYCPNLLSIDEARVIFKRFDNDNNNFLDFKELQSFNAYLFNNFPRAQNKTKELKFKDEHKKNDQLNETVQISWKRFFTFQPSITYLDLSFQAIRKIPNAIEIMQNLKVLKLKYCVYLESLSAKLGTLKLNELDLTGCISLKTPPLEIQRRGVNSVLAYLNRLLTGSVECKRTKLMMLGLGGAGKTSLIEALINNVLQNGNQPPPNLTDGISISDWEVNVNEDQNLTFSVFDFAGQVVYYNTHQFFLSNRSIYVLVWNVRLGADHSGLEFWLNSIECHVPNCPIFVVGTHIDEVSKYGLPIERYKKKYPQIVGFYFVSSFDGKGIDNLAKALINTALKEKYMGEKIPKCWLDFESKLHEIKKEKYFLEYQEVEKIAESHGIFDQAELSQALVFLHDLGSIMYFNNQFLRDKVVINPQFMVDLLACVVSVNNVFITDGRLWNQDVDKIWKKYSPSLHKWILKITEKFELTFAIPDQDHLLVPCLLPETPPKDIDWSELSTKNQVNRQSSHSSIQNVSKNSRKKTIIIYTFEYLPIGLFNRAQVRLYLLTDSKTIWKNGSIIRKNNHTALILKRENIIEIKCVGIQPENLIFLIHEVLETLISESFNGVNYDFSFPCPDCYENDCINVNKSMFSASLVRQATRLKAVFLQCRNVFHVVPIADLHSKMPPDSIDSYDLQLKSSVRDLKHLKQKLSTDIVILYSTKDLENDSIIKPVQIKADLEKTNFTVWFSEAPETVSVEAISVLIRNCSIVLFCITDNFCSDKRCVDFFNYVKINLSKPYVLVVLGESFEWQKTQVGALITNEFFIKINTIARYQTSLSDLIDLTKRKIDSVKNRKVKKQDVFQCFISYCRVNSQDAISKGTPLKTKESLGWGDPRELKKNIEQAGYSVWIDFEQVGNKKNLFEDIVEGVRNCKLFIACISNEYALSENCMKEFRFASNLKKPILLCSFGSANRKSEWKNTELGIISCLNNKEVNFQLENPKAYEEILTELKKLKIEPIMKNPTREEDMIGEEDDETNNEAYSELVELTQRKFLRQVANFSDNAASRPFPRLIMIDLTDDSGLNILSGNSFTVNMNSSNLSSFKTNLSSSKRRNDKFSPNRTQVTLEKFCLRIACEHESGWHSSGLPIEYESLKNIPLGHISYLYRIMSIVKHSDLNMDILKNQEKYQDLVNHLEDMLNLGAAQQQDTSNQQSFSNVSPVKRFTSSNNESTNLHSFKDSYGSLKNFIFNKLDFMSTKMRNQKTNVNLNRLDHFELNRCSLPSGKIVWLCDEHSKEEHVQILTSMESVNFAQFQNDEFNAILSEELKKYET